MLSSFFFRSPRIILSIAFVLESAALFFGKFVGSPRESRSPSACATRRQVCTCTQSRLSAPWYTRRTLRVCHLHPSALMPLPEKKGGTDILSGFKVFLATLRVFLHARLTLTCRKCCHGSLQQKPSRIRLEVFRLLRLELDEFGPPHKRFPINIHMNYFGTAMIISIRCLEDGEL